MSLLYDIFETTEKLGAWVAIFRSWQVDVLTFVGLAKIYISEFEILVNFISSLDKNYLRLEESFSF